MGKFYAERDEPLVYYYQPDHGIEALGFQIISLIEPITDQNQNESKGVREMSKRANKVTNKITLSQADHDKLIKLSDSTSNILHFSFIIPNSGENQTKI